MRVLSFHALLALCSACLSGCMGPWPGLSVTSQDLVGEPRVGFLYVGPIGDHGWTLTHELGRQYVNEELGVFTHYEPSVLPTDAVETMESFIEQGDNIIFTTSHEFLSATQTIAANHPEVSLLSCSGFSSSPNMGSYFGRMYQAKYLTGLVAGSMSCTGKVGYVAPVNIPEVVRHINAFALGVREVNPDAIVYVYWVGNWFDVDIEPVATQTLIDLGSDIVVSGTDTTIPLEVAAGQQVTCDATGAPTPVYTIGYDNPDACDASPEWCLTSAYWSWGPLYADLVSSIWEGSWDPSQIIWEQMRSTPEESVVGMSEMSSKVPGPVRILADQKIPELVAPAGIHLPFRGPLRDTTGALRLAEGQELQDEDLLEMCWHVDGVRNALSPEVAETVVPPGCGGVQ